MALISLHRFFPVSLYDYLLLKSNILSYLDDLRIKHIAKEWLNDMSFEDDELFTHVYIYDF